MDTLATFWEWLKNAESREIVRFIGGGFIALVGAAWAVFKWLHRHKPPDRSEGTISVSQTADKVTRFPNIGDEVQPEKHLRQIPGGDALAPDIELFRNKIQAGFREEALNLFKERLAWRLAFEFCAPDLEIELLSPLFPDGLPSSPENRICLPDLKNEGDQAWVLNETANCYRDLGHPRTATLLYEKQCAIRGQQGALKGLALGRYNLGECLLLRGKLKKAEEALSLGIAYFAQEKHRDLFHEAVGLGKRGLLFAYMGNYQGAEIDLGKAIQTIDAYDEVQSLGLLWAHRAINKLLEGRESSGPWQDEAYKASWMALRLAEDTTYEHFSHERDFIRAHWLCGAVWLSMDHHAKAEGHLSEARVRARRIKLVEFETPILLELSRLWLKQNQLEKAQTCAKDALEIATLCDYRLVQADAHLMLAQLALGRGDYDTAWEEIQNGRERALCDGENHRYLAAWIKSERYMKNIAHRAR